MVKDPVKTMNANANIMSLTSSFKNKFRMINDISLTYSRHGQQKLLTFVSVSFAYRNVFGGPFRVLEDCVLLKILIDFLLAGLSFLMNSTDTC